jgi:hypothetical protein
MSERPLIYDESIQKFKSDVGVGTVNPFVSESGTATLTNKTLTSATLTTPTITGGTLIPRVTDMAVDGAVTIQSGIVTFSKAGVLAATLAAPTAAQAGTRITFISLTDNAHTLTCPTNTLNDGTTGINELGTFAAFAGASITVVAIGVLWYVESFSAVVITSTV